MLVLFSCRTTKVTTNTDVVPIVVPDNPDVPINPVVKDTVKMDPIDIIEVEDTLKDYIETKKFQIALMLPFSLDDYNLNTSDAMNLNFKKSSSMAIEFYQGFEMAIDEIQQSVLNAEVYVLDTRNNSQNVTQLLNSPPFPKVDLVIGPVFNKNLRIASTYCAKNEIAMISPLSSSSSITSDNPFYYAANGTSVTHYEKLVNHLKKMYPSDTVHVIHNGTQKEKDAIDLIKEINQERFKDDPIAFEEIHLEMSGTPFELKEHFDSLSIQIVLVPSYSEEFCNYALNQMAQIKTYFPSVVFGMPTWNTYKNINYDYYEWLQVHITQSYWVNEFNIDVANMKRDFNNKYGIDPTQYAYQGYDLANYVATCLADIKKIRKHKEQFFVSDQNQIGLQTKFQFKPRMKESSEEINYWDNSYIHVLKFENYMFNKVD